MLLPTAPTTTANNTNTNTNTNTQSTNRPNRRPRKLRNTKHRQDHHNRKQKGTARQSTRFPRYSKRHTKRKPTRHDKNTVYIYFVHVPKTAGSAVKHTLKVNEEALLQQELSKQNTQNKQNKPQSSMMTTRSKEGWTFYTPSGRRVRIIARGHCPARRFPPRASNVFKVATIREPVERFISAYNFVREGGINHPDQGAVQQARDWAPFLQKYDSFNAFVKDKSAMHTIMSPHTGHTHFDHLMPWLCSSDGTLDIDMVIRQTHVSADFQAMCDALNIPLTMATVEKRNVTGARFTASPATQTALKNLLCEDIKLYNELERKATEMQEHFKVRTQRFRQSAAASV